MRSGRLYLEFCGEDVSVEQDDELTFGRSADLVIDDNPYLHRVVGRFVARQGVWWLENLGRTVTLSLRSLDTLSTSTLGPGAGCALNHGEFSCSFSAGPTRYELLGSLEGYEWATDLLGADGVAGTRTLDWGRVELNDDQRLLLAAMCEERLLHPFDPEGPIPSNRQRATRLGWTINKFNRKLDHLCEKLGRAGVPDVHGGLGANAVDRRRRVVDHAITSGLVTLDDLRLLDEPGRAA